MTGFREAFALSKDAVRLARPLRTTRLADYLHPQHGDWPLHYPPPSSDPVDPLNWPLKLKVASLLCMSIYGFLVNFASASIASAFPLLASRAAFDPPVPLGDLSSLISVNVLMLGAANLLWVPLANTFGRRPSLLAARLFMGLTGAPADMGKCSHYLRQERLVVAPTVVGEVFFTYQRGRAIGLYTVLLALGPLVGGLVAGYIADNLGIPWINWINAIVSGVLLVTCFFLQPETLFTQNFFQEAEDANGHVCMDAYLDISSFHSQSHSTPQRFSYFKYLHINLHPCSDFKFTTYLSRPFLSLRLPGVWLVMLWYAGLVSGLPPYLWGPNVGCINIGGIIGVLLGFSITSLFSDRIITWQGVKCRVAYLVAEVRLPLAIPGLVLATTGLWVFGFCAENPGQMVWVGMEVGLGMLCLGLMLVPAIGFTDVIEAYGRLAPDSFVAIASLRAIISFCWTFFVGYWVTEAGAAVPFGVFGAIMAAFSLLLVPVLLWGKRTRIATEKWVL
ncbi:major facilitator superfamily domain-containing protein [Aspergillus crustosus]